jgi:hypothetical protein
VNEISVYQKACHELSSLRPADFIDISKEEAIDNFMNEYDIPSDFYDIVNEAFNDTIDYYEDLI